jgi:hypothetical protein
LEREEEGLYNKEEAVLMKKCLEREEGGLYNEEEVVLMKKACPWA